VGLSLYLDKLALGGHMRRHKTSLRNFIETMSTHHDVINGGGRHETQQNHKTPVNIVLNLDIKLLV